MALTRMKDNLPSISHEQSIELLNKAHRMCITAKDKVASIDVPQVASKAKEWVIEHPYKTGFYVTSGVLIVAPGLVTAPALGLAGFTAEGVASGSVAAAAQSPAGQVAARSGFATLQSAGAAGYGLPIVNGAVRGTIAGSQALNVGIRALWKKDQKPGDAEGSEHVETAGGHDSAEDDERGDNVDHHGGNGIVGDQDGAVDGAKNLKAKL